MEHTAVDIPEFLLRYPSELKGGDFDLSKLLGKARGVAFLRVYRLGCIVTVRGSRGLLFAKNEATDEWSAPSAIQFGGIAVGADIGLERSDFMVIIKTKDALDSFAKNALQAGLNGCLALGPFGRSGEIAIGSGGDIVVVSRSVGIYGGVSLEFSGLLHDDAKNQIMYGTRDTSAILGGEMKHPEGKVWDRCFKFLSEHTGADEPAQEVAAAAQDASAVPAQEGAVVAEAAPTAPAEAYPAKCEPADAVYVQQQVPVAAH